MSFDPKVINALAKLRKYARQYPTMGVSSLINELDNASVFAALDEQTGYAAASGLGKLERVPGTDTLRPAPETDEWTARARAIEDIRPKGRRSHGSLAADND
jgi:hypothetical protein